MNPFQPSDLFPTILSLLTNPPDKSEALTTEVGEQAISTVLASDTVKWETGIKRDGIWIIVEQYDDDGQAKIGHKKWATRIRNNRNLSMKVRH